MRPAETARLSPFDWLASQPMGARFLHWDLEEDTFLAGAGVADVIEGDLAALDRARDGDEWFALAPFRGERVVLIKPARVFREGRERTQGDDVEIPRDLITRDPAGEGDYRARVARGLEHIGRGDVEKVVLAHAFERGIDREPLDVLRALSQGARGTALYLELDDAGFLGVSPERLYKRQGTRFWIDCLAGTAKAGAAEDVLKGDDKERREHAFVVRAVREALAGLSRFVSVPEVPRIKRAGRVQHLWTPVRGELKAPRSLLDVLHPTPAVAGTPRDRAMAIVRELEPFDRGLYAGAFGRVRGHDEDFNVVLRAMRFSKDRATVFAGAGIVRGSEPEREWREVQQKAAALLEELG